MATTVREAFAGPDSAYWGDDETAQWLIIESKHRDSDALARANFDAARKLAAERGIECETMTAGHWLVGYVEYAIVPPTDAARELAACIEAELADYPVLDEELWSEYEYTEVLETLADFTRYGLGRSAEYGPLYTPPDPEAFAPYLYDALTARNGDSSPYLERWPNIERGQSAVYDERVCVADALRAYRNAQRTSTSIV